MGMNQSSETVQGADASCKTSTTAVNNGDAEGKTETKSKLSVEDTARVISIIDDYSNNVERIWPCNVIDQKDDVEQVYEKHIEYKKRLQEYNVRLCRDLQWIAGAANTYFDARLIPSFVDSEKCEPIDAQDLYDHMFGPNSFEWRRRVERDEAIEEKKRLEKHWNRRIGFWINFKPCYYADKSHSALSFTLKSMDCPRALKLGLYWLPDSPYQAKDPKKWIIQVFTIHPSVNSNILGYEKLVCLVNENDCLCTGVLSDLTSLKSDEIVSKIKKQVVKKHSTAAANDYQRAGRSILEAICDKIPREPIDQSGTLLEAWERILKIQGEFLKEKQV